MKRLPDLEYQTLWAGVSVAESTFSFQGDSNKYRLISQKESVGNENDRLTPFITTSKMDAESLIMYKFPERWSIEEFFNFEGDMAWNRASTFNLNIRYGRQTMALLAHAATRRLRNNLPENYKKYNAQSLANKVLANMEGDIRVKDDKIIVTYYKDHEPLLLKDKYQNISQTLENEGVSPKIPWLFDFKLEFRFK